MVDVYRRGPGQQHGICGRIDDESWSDISRSYRVTNVLWQLDRVCTVSCVLIFIWGNKKREDLFIYFLFVCWLVKAFFFFFSFDVLTFIIQK